MNHLYEDTSYNDLKYENSEFILLIKPLDFVYIAVYFTMISFGNGVTYYFHYSLGYFLSKFYGISETITRSGGGIFLYFVYFRIGGYLKTYFYYFGLLII